MIGKKTCSFKKKKIVGSTAEALAKVVRNLPSAALLKKGAWPDVCNVMAGEMLEKNMDVQKKVIFVWIVSEFGNRIMKIYVNYVYDGISDGQVIFTERKFCPNGLISLIKLG